MRYALIAAAIACLFSCTKREETEARQTGAAVAQAVGLPPFLGEGIAGLAIAAASYFGGKKHGHIAERKRAAKS